MEKNNANRHQQGGSGSAEQTGRERTEQKTPTTRMNENEKSEVASAISENKQDVRTIEDLGGMSGRDDLAGGSGDRMENQSTGQSTEKFGRSL